MAIINALKNIGLDAMAAVAVWAGALDGAGAEITGGTPAYARKAVAWSSATAGIALAKATFPVFDIPASTTVSQVMLIGASVGGVTYATYDATDEYFAGQGTYTVTGITLSI